MAKLKTETLISMLKQRPAVVRKFLEEVGEGYWQTYFPDYKVHVKMKKVKNFISGIEFDQIDTIQITIPIHTPLHMDPSSETYHSM